MIGLKSLGFDKIASKYASVKSPHTFPARVCCVHPGHCEIATGQTNMQAVVSKALLSDAQQSIVVGDWVITSCQNGTIVIEEIISRYSLLQRKLPGNTSGYQSLAANIDKVLITTAIGHDFSPKRILRYLTLVWQSNAKPIIVVNKVDNTPDTTDYLQAIHAIAPGIPTFFISAHLGQGIKELIASIETYETVVVVGSSGVGKSSLLNRLAGHDLCQTSAVRSKDDKGRHTTTNRTLWCVQDFVFIDIPGIREVGLTAADNGIQSTFADILSLATQCRFRNCTHSNEPGCAVLDAVHKQKINPDRLSAYLSMNREQAAAAERADVQTRKKNDRKLSKKIKESQSNRKRKRTPY